MPDPVRRLVCPSIGRPGGTGGHRSVGVGGATGGVPHPFPLSSSTICGAHPYAFVQPLVHQGGCARGDHPGYDCQGCGGACSASLSRFLQPSVRGLENLGIMVSGHQSLDPQSLHGCVTLPDGVHLVCPPFRPSGRLDGLHRSLRGLPSGSCPSGISSLPPLCDQWPGISVQDVVFRPIRSPAGFHSGETSVCNHTFPEYLISTIPHPRIPRHTHRPRKRKKTAPTTLPTSLSP